MPAPQHTDTEIYRALLSLFHEHGKVRLVDAARHLDLSASGLHGRLTRMISKGTVALTPVGWMPTEAAFEQDRFSEGQLNLYWQAPGDGSLYIYPVGTDGSPNSSRR